uniref:Uncharacterized protein n=1 Tax=Anguilla anguilla TaxID=7936 RepID=A0A0E9WA60_ANGAN
MNTSVMLEHVYSFKFIFGRLLCCIANSDKLSTEACWQASNISTSTTY